MTQWMEMCKYNFFYRFDNKAAKAKSLKYISGALSAVRTSAHYRVVHNKSSYSRGRLGDNKLVFQNVLWSKPSNERK